MSAAHAFVVPAYGESPYLAACLDSLLAQSVPSVIRVATSTPNAHVEDACRSRQVDLVVHSPSRGIGPDWNFALDCTDAPLVTLAHQDDVYAPGDVARILEMHQRHPGAGLFFCESHELDGEGRRRPVSRVLAVKRALARAAFIGTDAVGGGLRLRLLLGLGNAIACPTVTINREALGGFRFREDLRTNMDWFAWLDAARRAPVCYAPDALVGHRVHEQSETSRCIEDGSRRREDEMVFREFWPAPAAMLLSRVYRIGYEAPPK